MDISFVSDQPTLRIPSGSSVRLRRHFVLIVEPVERFDREHVAGAVLNQSSGDKVKGSVFKSLVSIVDTVSVSDVLGVRAGGSTTRSKGHCSRVAVRELNVASPVAPIPTHRASNKLGLPLSELNSYSFQRHTTTNSYSMRLGFTTFSDWERVPDAAACHLCKSKFHGIHLALNPGLLSLPRPQCDCQLQIVFSPPNPRLQRTLPVPTMVQLVAGGGGGRPCLEHLRTN